MTSERPRRVRPNMRRINVKVSDEVYQWFKARSERTGVAMSSLMFLTLEQAIREQEAMRGFPAFVQALEASRAERPAGGAQP
jgi:post-segregation antitoxin (ccd killing protein)